MEFFLLKLLIEYNNKTSIFEILISNRKRHLPKIACTHQKDDNLLIGKLHEPLLIVVGIPAFL